MSAKVALTLISEKVRFWTDDRFGFGEVFPPRLNDIARIEDLRKSLIEIDQLCKSALRAFSPVNEAKLDFALALIRQWVPSKTTDNPHDRDSDLAQALALLTTVYKKEVV